MYQHRFPRMRVNATPANVIGGVFYATVALIALVGQTMSATEWLRWPAMFAAPAVAALELGGIALTAHADVRRRLGERAVAARLMSAAVAAFAVVFNWLGHGDHRQGAFFAGMSALGYGVWLINAGARRRDQMRSDGTLPPVAPVYGWVRWVRHPLHTWQARALALATPQLGLYGSLAQATADTRRARREATIAAILHRKLKAAKDPLTAELATTVFDLNEIAARLTAGADYAGLTAMIAADLTPTALVQQDQQQEVAPVVVRPVAVSAPVTRPEMLPVMPTYPVAAIQATTAPAPVSPAPRMPRAPMARRPVKSLQPFKSPLTGNQIGG
jgi:hypothetical protein